MIVAHTRFQTIAVSCIFVAWIGSGVLADPLSIHDIQYVDLTADPTGTSPYDGMVVDCTGGIVTHIRSDSRPRLILQDPNHSNGWGGIQVKGWGSASDFDGIQIGDWVSLTSVYVEDYRGTTYLLYGGDSEPAPNASFQIESHGNPLPNPLPVTLDQIAAPIENSPGQWLVVDHSAEPFESMVLRVENVGVDALGLGKAYDNYNLHNAMGDVWASDYMNGDRPYDEDYLPVVQNGSQFLSVSGVLEQYTRVDSYSDEIIWDYYQLLTANANDLVVLPEPAAGVLVFMGLLLMVACHGKSRLGTRFGHRR